MMVGNLFSNFAKATGRNLTDFKRAQGGNIAVVFALSLMPVVAGVGGAVDFGRAYVAKARLLEAIDAAALAVGSSQLVDEDKMTELAQKYFDANYDNKGIGDNGKINLSAVDGTISITANAHLKTVLLGVVGMDTIDVGAKTTVVRESKALEVALVLDNTGSMGNSGKLTALKTAASTMTKILFGDNTTHPKLKIGLVPFSQTVKVGPDAKKLGWMDENAQSSLHGENFVSETSTSFLEGPAEPKFAAIDAWADAVGSSHIMNAAASSASKSATKVNIFSLYDEIKNVSWGGCVESRPEPYDTSDDTPSSGTPDTLFVPYFYPDEPDNNHNVINNYLKDGVSGAFHKRQESIAKYKNANVSSKYAGPNYGCNIPAITSLTNVKASVLSAVDAMGASGYTHIPLGLAWGWRILSPSAPYTEGAAYDDDDTTKALIVLTDGMNTIQKQKNENLSSYTAYGYLHNMRFGNASLPDSVKKLNTKTATLCNKVKAAGIRVYTITFKLNNSDTQKLFRECATEPGLYFNSPSNEQLQSSFTAIARDLSNLRISK